jgi:hypothetical protein
MYTVENSESNCRELDSEWPDPKATNLLNDLENALNHGISVSSVENSWGI